MINVKRVFFLTVEETEKLRNESGDGYILNHHPHYELEDGTTLYTRGGASDFAIETIVTEVQPKATNSKVD